MATRRVHAVGALPLHLADFLLGQSRTAAEIDALHTAGIEYDALAALFDLDGMSRDRFLALWTRHRPQLEVEAQVRGLTLRDPNAYEPFCWVRSTTADPGDDDGPS